MSNNNALQNVLLGLLLGGVAVWLFMTSAGSAVPGSMMNFRSSSQNNVMSAQIDAHFIEQMIPHHEDAITMARVALDKSQRNEIKQLAQAIITSQGAEISQMQAWYKDWFGRELPIGDQVMLQHGMMGASGMHMGILGNQLDVDRLEQAVDFDRAFIEHMIPHHQMAVMMASMLASGTQRAEMKQLAEDIITAQTTEIGQMREWYSAWY